MEEKIVYRKPEALTDISGISLKSCDAFNMRLTPAACAAMAERAERLNAKTDSRAPSFATRSLSWEAERLKPCMTCTEKESTTRSNMCRTPGCVNTGWFKDGFCQRCSRESEAKKRRGNSMPDGGGGGMETEDKPGRKTHCVGCGQDKKETGRLYKGRCADCREKPKSDDPPPTPSHTHAEAPPQQTITDPALGKAILEGVREAEMRVTLDFTDYPKLLAEIATLAKKEFRATEGQILFILMERHHRNLTDLKGSRSDVP